MPIQVLPEQLASQIAAGEVVERPASVVKELVENAIDAGATTVNVEVRDGGRQLVQVADNGAGIPAQEIETAFLRHATSKLGRLEDLAAISTLGFRGEALAAIAAVSQITVVARAVGETAGTRLVLEAGQKVSRETVGAAQGTVIAIENLFYNVPARLKFLKSASTEKRLIDEFVTRYALAYPGIRFRLSHNGRITFQTSGSGKVLDVLVAIYGPETARQLLAVGDSRLDIEPSISNLESPISVSGFVGPPSLHWANRSHITLFVNGRWVRDNSLTYAVIQAYHTLLPTGRYPLGVIFVTMPPADVDVNVHPTKSEVRFRRRTPFSAVQRAVRQTLVTETPVRAATFWTADNHSQAPRGWAGELDAHAFTHLEGEEGPSQTHLDLDWPPPATSDTDSGSLPDPSVEVDPSPSAQERGKRLPIMRVIGQVGASYIITEGPDGVFLIDQHAAHERILYEQFMAAWQRQAVMSQRLVAGAAVHLPPAQATLLEAHLEILASLGFEVEPFGPNAFMVRAVPAVVAQLDPAQALVAVVEDLERGDEPLQDKIEAKIIRRVCKTAAVKAGHTLSPAEMAAMIRQLEACTNPHTCPHGRPTLIYLSVAQLARQFGRI